MAHVFEFERLPVELRYHIIGYVVGDDQLKEGFGLRRVSKFFDTVAWYHIVRAQHVDDILHLTTPDVDRIQLGFYSPAWETFPHALKCRVLRQYVEKKDICRNYLNIMLEELMALPVVTDTSPAQQAITKETLLETIARGNYPPWFLLDPRSLSPVPEPTVQTPKNPEPHDLAPLYPFLFFTDINLDEIKWTLVTDPLELWRYKWTSEPVEETYKSLIAHDARRRGDLQTVTYLMDRYITIRPYTYRFCLAFCPKSAEEISASNKKRALIIEGCRRYPRSRDAKEIWDLSVDGVFR
ncbi:hypothetical protein BJX99DRAFT_232876 [Aspergillus californicus]